MKPAPNAFKRALAMASAVQAAFLLPVWEQLAAFEKIGEYRSRGKGQGGRFLGSSARCVAMDKRKARNKRKEKNRG